MRETIAAPLENFVTDGNTIVEWLGSFWTRIYEDPDFIRGNQYGRSLLASQAYLTYLEAVGIIGRHTVPALHRERWHPLVIRQDQVDTGSSITIGMDPTPVIGPQQGDPFITGTVFKIGGPASFGSLLSYPLGVSAEKVVTCLVDNIVNPKFVLVNGVDFTISDGNIYFLREKDPFTLGFPSAPVTDANGVESTETLLWACDLMIDRDYIYTYVGYVVGVRTESTDFYATMLNALWDLYVDGTTVKLFQTAWGAMLGVPTVIHATETVVEILPYDGDRQQVVTDAEVYTLPGGSHLRDAVVPGAVLTCGEFLTTAIRLYETLDPMKLDAVSEFGLQMKEDVPQLFMSKDLFRAQLESGLSASWDISDIVYTGSDANGNPKLQFDLQGTDADIEAFWNDFWAYCVTRNISCDTCFSDYLDAIVTPVVGAVWGRVAPLEFFFRYFLKTNGLIVILDRSQIPETGRQQNVAAMIRLMRETLPAYVYMFVIEQRAVGPEEFDLETDASDEDLDAYWSLSPVSAARYGKPSTTTLTYLDRRPVVRWIPVCEGEIGGSQCP